MKPKTPIMIKAENDLRLAVLGYLVSISPASVWMYQIIEHFKGFGERALRSSVRKLISSGLVKEYSGMFFASENGVKQIKR